MRGESILTAVATLQRAGFKVSVPEGFRFGSLTPTPTVGDEAPLGGTKVPLGATVTLSHSRYGCCIGSPGGGALRVPDLVGSTAQQAIRELRRMQLPWEIRVRPFFNEQRALLTTVRVVGQSPAPGMLVVHDGFHVPTMTAAYPANRPASDRPDPVTDPASLILKSWLDPPQVEIKAAPGDKVLEVQIPKHLTSPEMIAARWQATVDALATTSVRVVGVGMNDTPTTGPDAVGAASFTLHRTNFKLDTAAALRSSVPAKAADLGLKVIHLTVTDTAAGPAVNLIATPSRGTAAAFAKKNPTPSASADLHALGVLVQVIDANGNVVLADGGSSVTEIEFTWIDPSLHICYSIGCLS